MGYLEGLPGEKPQVAREQNTGLLERCLLDTRPKWRCSATIQSTTFGENQTHDINANTTCETQ